MAYNEIRTINNIQLEDIKARQSIQELDNKKANKSDIVSGLNFKGTTTYSALPTSNNSVGDFYYVTDGDGTNGEGNYAWNGTAWYFSGKTTDFGDISTKANAAVNNAAFEEGKLKVTKNDGTSTETEVVDSSLTKSGKAADAKITGDEIGQLKEDLDNTNNQLLNAAPNLYYKSGNIKKYPLYCAQADINGNIIMETIKAEDAFITNTPVRLYIAFSDVSQPSGKVIRIRAGNEMNADIARKDINLGLVDTNTKVVALNIDFSNADLSNAVFNDIRLLPTTVGVPITVTNVFATTDMETDYSEYVTSNNYGRKLLIPKNRVSTEEVPIICIGDSMINAGGSMKDKLKESTNLSFVLDYGVGGDNVLSTLAHIGESPFLVEPFTIPSDTVAVPISIKSSYGDGDVNPAIEWYENGACTIHGIKGVITYPDHTIRKDYKFQRSKAGNSETVNRDEFIILDSGIKTQAYKSFVPIVWFGTNGGWKSVDALVQIHERIAKYCNSRNFIFIGFYMQGNTPVSTIEEYENLMENHFSYKFINMRKYLVENGLSICNITPTEEDNQAISEGKVPPSLLEDGVHYTPDVKEKIVMPLIIERLKLMGVIN